jgi:ABC-2 type transport system ATP-binding protein
MSGLDPVGRREVRDLILAQRAAGGTVFFSSHILQDAEMICDRVAILVQGKVRFEGALEDLVSRKVLWYEVAVRGVPPGGLAAELLSSTGAESLLRVRDVEGLARVLASVQSLGGQVTSVWPRRETLEDLFMREVATGGSREAGA